MKNYKLELKHLAPYLPYELKMYHSSVAQTIKGKGKEYTPTKLKKLTTENLFWVGRESDSRNLKEAALKPVLRPLSDLTKEIEVNGEKFVPIERLRRIYNTDFGYIEKLEFHNIDGITLYGLTDGTYEVSMPYFFYERLFELHFDVFGLIEKGLAIDMNSL